MQTRRHKHINNDKMVHNKKDFHALLMLAQECEVCFKFGELSFVQLEELVLGRVPRAYSQRSPRGGDGAERPNAILYCSRS